MATRDEFITSAADLRFRVGFSVIPLIAGTKKPIVSWEKYQKERAGYGEILLWWSAEDSRNDKKGIAEVIISKQRNGLMQLLFLVVTEYPCEPAPLDDIKQMGVTQIFLEIKHLILRYAKHFWYVELLLTEMFCQQDEGPVFIPGFTMYADKGYLIQL